MASNLVITLLFFCIVLVCYYLTPMQKRWCVLLAASYLFYMSVNPWMGLLLAGSTLWSWYTGLKIGQAGEQRAKTFWLLACMLPFLGILFLFKYFNFFVSSFVRLLGALGIERSGVALKLVIPLGISYYTFKIISYGADIYKGKIEPETHPGYYALYVSFFPQIQSGPIERAAQFLPQLREGLRFQEGLFAEGLTMIVLGLFKKVVIANRLSDYVGLIFDAPEKYPAIAAWMAAVLFSIQIYCDFSGYSDLAVGMAGMMGISTRKNFERPYFSRDIKEFWRRWHISLTSWLRDYIYIPLGGNRVSRLRKHCNVMVTFLVSGLWHGDSWTYLIWGGIHGFWNICSYKKKEAKGFFQNFYRTALTFSGVTLAWIFFRAPSFTHAVQFLKRMFLELHISFAELQASILPFTGDNTCAAYVLTAGFFIFMLIVKEWQETYGKKNYDSFWICFMTVSILLFGVFSNSSFLYAQF